MKLSVNPVLEKEAKIKMRSWRAPALLSVYLLFLSGIVILYFVSRNLDGYYSNFDPRTALNIYTMLSFFQLGLLIFIIPGLTSAAISGERERQTLDLLLCTRLSSWSVVIGKLTASLSHVMLLIAASIPVFSIVFLYGGISPLDVISVFLFQIVTAFLVGSIGIFFSSLFKRTAVATIVTYTVLLMLVVGTIAGYVFYAVTRHRLLGWYPSFWESLSILSVNPFIGLGALLEKQTGHFGFVSEMLRRHSTNVPHYIEGLPWMINIGFNIVLSVVLLLLSAWLIKPGRR